MKKDLTVKHLLGKAATIGRQLQKYSLFGFLALLAVVYGFLLFRITSLNNEQPSSTVVDEQVKSAHVPRIDTAIVRQLQSLQDNSVSVHALFDEARNNPFQE